MAGWLWLVGLSVLAAALAALSGQAIPRTAAGTAILVLALMKGRVILARYLGLDAAPGWLSGFVWSVVLWGVLVLGLYLAPVISP